MIKILGLETTKLNQETLNKSVLIFLKLKHRVPTLIVTLHIYVLNTCETDESIMIMININASSLLKSHYYLK